MTELCKMCAKAKNVCQTCVFDLVYGLPVQVRDSVLREHEKINLPESTVGKNYMLAQLERTLDDPATAEEALSQYSRPSAVLERLARTGPYYDRNRAKICTFFIRGACTRGTTCPYRHEMPVHSDLSKQNIKDRYSGSNDPVANKILKKAAQGATASALAVQPPEDPTISTLFLGNVPLESDEVEIRAALSPFGPISSIKMLSEKCSAIVTFLHRSSAEDAISRLHNCLRLADKPVRMAWGKKKSSTTEPGQSLGGPPPPPGMITSSNAPMVYPSMSKDYVPSKPMNKPPPPPGM